MAEPHTTSIVAAGVSAGFLGSLASVNPEAAVGALFGALIYFTTTRELPVWKRTLFFITSFCMGYLFAPALGELEMWGVRPFGLPGPAAFLASLMVVTVSLAALRARAPVRAQEGSHD